MNTSYNTLHLKPTFILMLITIEVYPSGDSAITGFLPRSLFRSASRYHPNAITHRRDVELGRESLPDERSITGRARAAVD